MIVLSDDDDKDEQDDDQIFLDVPVVNPDKKKKTSQNDGSADLSYLLEEKDNDAMLNMPVSLAFLPFLIIMFDRLKTIIIFF